MKILVTGSSGTIGTRLVEKLLERGNEVIPVDREPNKWHAQIDAHTRRIDLLDLNEIASLPEDIDAIVHLAANARVYELVEHPDRALENIQTTFNILEFARTMKIKKFLFASSRETYGNLGAKTYGEDLARIENCESPYTASKIAGEALVESYKRCYGIEHITLRFSNVYGMYDDSERVVPLFIRKARANEPLTVFGQDKCLDFTYIDDAVAGVVLAIDTFAQTKNDVYNIAYGKGTTIEHLANRIVELTGSSSTIEMGKPRTGEVIRYVADISKVKEKLGFAPKVAFEEGIEKTVKWYEDQGKGVGRRA